MTSPGGLATSVPASRPGAGTDPDSIVAPLDPEQRQVVLAPPGPVRVLAGAGTGKTRAITHRIAYLTATGVATPQTVLAVTFTARAAGELRGRLRALGAEGVQARTFHAAALRQLGFFWPRVAGAALPRLVESKIGLVGRAAGRLRLSPSRTELRDLTSEIEWAKARMVTPDDYPAAAAAAGREADQPPEVIARLYATYEEVKRAAEVLDFDDLLLLCAAMLEEHGWVASQLREQYRHFVVDEYQDVNPLQQRLLDAWVGERDSLCVVGDPNQTIYSFTGATPGYLLEFPDRFPSAALVRLVRDYRSTPQVVRLANGLMARAGRGAGAGGRRPAAGAELVAQRPDGPAAAWSEHDSEPEEARAVAKAIQALIRRGVPAAEIAILYRVNAQSEAYEAALATAGVAYLVRGGERFFERPEVVEAVRLLRAAARAADDDRPDELAAQVADAFAALNWRADDPPSGGGAERERWENLAALVRLATDLAAARPEAQLGDLVAELAERAAFQHAPTVSGVTLASLHAAKGLEWDAVFLVGLVEGTMPIVHAETDEAIEEERRLLYVGITRARQYLSLSWSLARNEGGRRSRRPSRFLDGLRPAGAARSGSAGPSGSGGPSGGGGAAADGAAGAASGRRVRGAVRCRVCGQSLTGSEARAGRCDGCPSDVDSALFERLRAWRTAKAKALGVPAYVVYTDATLRTIAERRPASVAELVAIPGIGQAKLDRYGSDTLDLVAGRPVVVEGAGAEDEGTLPGAAPNAGQPGADAD